MTQEPSALLGASHIRELASAFGLRPTKALGQNFVHDAGTVRKVVREAGVEPGDVVVEVGPGLGSLTLALLEAGASVSAIEIDPVLAAALPVTVESRLPDAQSRLAVLNADAMGIASSQDLAAPGGTGGALLPRRLVANLPYNVAVPILLTLLEALPSLESATVMVQAEVADRLAAPPGSRTYGAPSAKVAWYAQAKRGSSIGRKVFWPVPNVDSALVNFFCRPVNWGVPREGVFRVIDAAFSQRRKTLRGSLATWAGSALEAEQILRAAGIDPKLRGEQIGIEGFVAIAKAAGEWVQLPVSAEEDGR